MDLATFDATDLPSLQPGSLLEPIGPHMPPGRVASRAGTNGCEAPASPGRRHRRVRRGA